MSRVMGILSTEGEALRSLDCREEVGRARAPGRCPPEAWLDAWPGFSAGRASPAPHASQLTKTNHQCLIAGYTPGCLDHVRLQADSTANPFHQHTR